MIICFLYHKIVFINVSLSSELFYKNRKFIDLPVYSRYNTLAHCFFYYEIYDKMNICKKSVIESVHHVVVISNR